MDNDRPQSDVTPQEVGEAAVTFMSELAAGVRRVRRRRPSSRSTAPTSTYGSTGSELGLMVGPGGRTLTAIQDLVRVAAQRRLGDHETRLRIDVGGYREKRRAALEQFAGQVAAQVIETGKAEGAGADAVERPQGRARRDHRDRRRHQSLGRRRPDTPGGHHPGLTIPWTARLIETLRDAQRFGFFGRTADRGGRRALDGVRRRDRSARARLPDHRSREWRRAPGTGARGQLSPASDDAGRSPGEADRLPPSRCARLGYDHVEVVADDVERVIVRCAEGELPTFDVVTARGFGPPTMTLRSPRRSWREPATDRDQRAAER